MKFGRGVVVRQTTTEETNAIKKYLPWARLRPFPKMNGNFICVERNGKWKNERKNPEQFLRALALLPRPIYLFPEVIELCRSPANNELVQCGQFRRAETVGSSAREAGGFLYSHFSIFNKTEFQRLRRLHKFGLAQDAFVDQFVAVQNILPNSNFRFVANMSIIEGMIGPTRQSKNIRENISSKLSYFYQHIFPNIKLADKMKLPQLRKDVPIRDFTAVWRDIYRIRNMVAHGDGGKLKPGETLKEIYEGFGSLQDSSTYHASEILEHGVRCLIYWHLESPDTVKNFREIS